MDPQKRLEIKKKKESKRNQRQQPYKKKPRFLTAPALPSYSASRDHHVVDDTAARQPLEDCSPRELKTGTDYVMHYAQMVSRTFEPLLRQHTSERSFRVSSRGDSISEYEQMKKFAEKLNDLTSEMFSKMASDITARRQTAQDKKAATKLKKRKSKGVPGGCLRDVSRKVDTEDRGNKIDK